MSHWKCFITWSRLLDTWALRSHVKNDLKNWKEICTWPHGICLHYTSPWNLYWWQAGSITITASRKFKGVHKNFAELVTCLFVPMYHLWVCKLAKKKLDCDIHCSLQPPWFLGQGFNVVFYTARVKSSLWSPSHNPFPEIWYPVTYIFNRRLW